MNTRLGISGGRRFPRGATLIEVAVATVIVGVAIVALMQFMVSATKANSALSERALALNIARAGQEWAASRTRAELDSWFVANPTGKAGELLGASAVTLVDTDPSRQKVYQGWSQTFSIEQINEADPTQPEASPSKLVQITVKVSKGNAEQCSLSRLYSDLAE